MTESKFKRVIVASTVGAVLLVVVLLMIMIYQLIAIGVENKRIREYEARIAEYNALIAEGVDVKQALMERDWIVYEARKLGYIFEGDKILD